MSKKKRIALIDGDGLVYKAVLNPDHRKEVKNDDDEYWEILNAKEAKEEFATRIAEVLGVLKCTKGGVVFAFGSTPYFRKRVDSSYKSNRKSRKPLGYGDFVKWVCETYHSILISGLEADDVLGVLQTTPGQFDDDAETIIFSNDKDMRTIPGLLVNPDDKKLTVETISETDALRSLFIQSLTGDTGDCFGGAKGVGKVKAGRIADDALEGVKCIEDVFESVIVKTYLDAGQTKEDALRNCRLARILTSEDVTITDDGEWNHELWTPPSFQPRSRRSARRSVRGSRKPRRPVRPVP